MKLETANLGIVEVEEHACVQFVQGLPGFENLSRFALLDVEEGLPYKWLQSVDNADIALLLADPFVFYPEYDWRLAEQDQHELQIKEESQVEVWSVITLAEDFQRSTINLLAPIVLNKVERLAKQLILHDTAYQTKHSLMRIGNEPTSPAEQEE